MHKPARLERNTLGVAATAAGSAYYGRKSL